MACALTSDLLLDCKDQQGGIKRIFVTELGNKNTIAYTEPAGNITTFSLLTGKQFFEYQLPKETSQVTENINSNIQNGTTFWQIEAVVVLHKREQAKRNELKLLALNRLMVIIHDRNDKYWLMGEKNGAELSAGSGVSGTAFGDLTGYNLTLMAQESEPMREVDSSLITALLTPAP